MEKELKEIRVSNWGLSSEIGSRFSQLSTFIGWLYIKKLGSYKTDNTEILLILMYEDKFVDEKLERFVKGKKIDGFIGETNYYFSVEEFLRRDNEGKFLFLLDAIHEACLKYMEYFSMPTDSLLKAYMDLKGSDFFVSHSSKPILSKNRKIELNVDLRVDYDLKTYRLSIIDRKTGIVKKLIVCEKKAFFRFDFPDLSISEVLKIPKTLRLDGWINENEYQMSWGKEKYIYNIISEQIDLRIDK